MVTAHNQLHDNTQTMEQQEPPEFLLDIFADPRSVHDIVKGILHTIFFHRFFPSITPKSRDILDISLPYVDDDELETMIEQRVAALERQLDAQRSSGNTNNASNGTGGRGQLVVQFFEKRRRKAWLSRGDEEVCWESWTVKVTVAEPRTESERAKVRRAMEQTLQATAMKIVTFSNTHKDHIPPITTQGTNPFPYKINLDQETTSWATRLRVGDLSKAAKYAALWFLST
ncbi:hypothetical protein F66182_9714 [Fusarium sp. NRRL 66182]|nr:hypothetical protein F66182_9714 [Fusarium sp. NRRL 66182]